MSEDNIVGNVPYSLPLNHLLVEHVEFDGLGFNALHGVFIPNSNFELSFESPDLTTLHDLRPYEERENG